MVSTVLQALTAITKEADAPKLNEDGNSVEFSGIDLKNNPRRLLNTPSDTAYYWIRDDKSILELCFGGIVVYNVAGDKTGPYFNLGPPGKYPVASAEIMAKARSGFAIMFTGEDTITSDGNPYPAEFLQHQKATLRYLTTLQDCAETYLDNLSEASKSGPTVSNGFIKEDVRRDAYFTTTVTTLLFPDAAKKSSTSVSAKSFLSTEISLSPSKRSKSMQGQSRAKSVHNWTINDLPDPESRYKSLAEGGTFSNHRINVPLVYDTTGKLIHPAEYRSKIPEGTLVVVRGVLKCYNITPSDREGSRPFQIEIRKMQVMPPSSITISPFFNKQGKKRTNDEDVFGDGEKETEGEAEASTSYAGSSPTKKGRTLRGSG